MARYHFDIIDGAFVPDNEGTEFSDFNEVRQSAKKRLFDAGLLSSSLDENLTSIRIIVRNTDQQIVFSASLSYSERSTGQV